MADGIRFTCYYVVQLTIKLKDLALKETSVVGRVNKSELLGMSFLANHGYTLDFGKPEN